MSEILSKLESIKIKKEELFDKQRNLKNWLAENDPSRGQQSKMQDQEKCISLVKSDPQIGWGIYGRLGDLGQIDPKYDKAISAVGTIFDSVLVESDEIAESCIKILRDRKAGSL